MDGDKETARDTRNDFIGAVTDELLTDHTENILFNHIEKLYKNIEDIYSALKEIESSIARLELKKKV